MLVEEILSQAESILATARRPSQAEQVALFQALGQVQRELPILAPGSDGWRRAEARRQALETKLAGWRE